MSQSRENLQTDGRTDGQTLFYRTFPAEVGGPIITVPIQHLDCEDAKISNENLLYTKKEIKANSMRLDN